MTGQHEPNREGSEENAMTDVPEEAVGRRILRLLAVERGLQDEGHGNAARLFRAAALSEALRATRVHPYWGLGRSKRQPTSSPSCARSAQRSWPLSWIRR